MKKSINIIMLVLIFGGIIFWIWSDAAYKSYVDGGLTPPQATFCSYDHIKYILAGIIGIWAGFNLCYRPSMIASLLKRPDSQVIIWPTFLLGLWWLWNGVLSFWYVVTSNLPYCK